MIFFNFSPCIYLKKRMECIYIIWYRNIRYEKICRKKQNSISTEFPKMKKTKKIQNKIDLFFFFFFFATLSISSDFLYIHSFKKPNKNCIYKKTEIEKIKIKIFLQNFPKCRKQHDFLFQTEFSSTFLHTIFLKRDLQIYISKRYMYINENQI